VSPTTLQDEARRLLALRRSSTYQHRTRVDEASGTFDLDCSGFVGLVLKNSAPDAFAEIARGGARPRPLARDYHDAFRVAGETASLWQPVRTGPELRPGDVIAWLSPDPTTSTGHVAIVDANPTPGPRDGELTVVVIDSARSGHGTSDTRTKGDDGLGRGPVVLLLGRDGVLIGFRWSSDRGSRRREVSVAAGRLRRS
jgi:hypothetical protein